MKTQTHFDHVDLSRQSRYAFADVGQMRDDRTGKLINQEARSNIGAFKSSKNKKSSGGGTPRFAGIVLSDYSIGPVMV